jgi:type IV pilus assembly protein PilY1
MRKPFSFSICQVAIFLVLFTVFQPEHACAQTAQCLDISSVPLSAIKRAAPPLIMFVLDDSGSMDWEFLTAEADGKFQEYEYVFDDPGDNVFAGTEYILSGIERMQWKSQWSGCNRLYYDPTVTYGPWPTLTAVSPDTPPSHPMHATPTFDLSATYHSFASGEVIVDNQDGTPAYVEQGEWFESGWQPEWDSSSRYTSASPATATFTPDLPEADTYEVYAWWNCSPYRDSNAKITIIHDRQTEILYRNQQGSEGNVAYCPSPSDPASPCCGQWIPLGTYNFSAGTGGSVTIERHAESTGTDTVADAVKFVPTSLSRDIKNAHYYVWSSQESKSYLINLDGKITYYEVASTGSGSAEQVTSLTPVTPPADVIPRDASGIARSYADERQNFANWYSFYRRRELTAMAAVANAIVNMQGVNLGLYSINSISSVSGSVKQPVLKVKAQGEDHAQELLAALYSLTISNQATPLRQALQAVGKYFDQTDSGDTGGIGERPYATAENGGECQQAFAIVMTDGYWNGPDPAVGDADGDNNTEFDGPPYAGPDDNTLADVAMHYYERDLVDDSDLNDLLPTSATDAAAHQHMVTYTVAFGVSGSLNPVSYDFESGPYPSWPDPFNTTDPKYNREYRIDDLWHAAVNGRGEFLSALGAEELANALLSIKLSIEARTGSAAPVSVNGVELYEELGPNLYMFQSTYDTNGWTGDVKAYLIDPVSGEIPETPVWMVRSEVDAMFWPNRKIATYNPDTSSGIPFQYTSLTDTQKTQLNSESTIVDFLRGDRSNEQQYGGTFRNRVSILGDIVHSSPVFENGVLYAGANDGMLHAFRATDGSEVFAYVPNLVFENLYELADPAYQDNHTFYVDLSPVTQQGVVLVGGLGGGGQGYYALNITGIDGSTSFSNDSAVADRVLWEYGGNADNDPDLGYTYARPSIVDSNDDDLNSGTSGWIVITGNGYNSVNGHAVLLILDPINGQVLKRIDTGVGACNGLSTPVVIDVNYDNKADYVYAGDLEGNLWKFDLTNADYTNWTVAFKDGSGNPQPLFQAPGQPITTKPDVMRHPQRHGYMVIFGTGRYLGITDFSDTSLNTIYGIWDYGDDSDDSEYLGAFNRGSPDTLSNQPEYVTLLEQGYVPSPITDPNNPYFWTVTVGTQEVVVRILTRNDPNWETVDDAGADQLPNPGSVTDPPNTVHAGWYFDLPVTGERVVSDVIIRDGNAIVISFMPPESCSTGGYSVVHEMDASTGGRLLTPQFDIDADAAIGTGDLINIGTEASPEWVAATGLRKTGRLHVPAILRMGSTEMKYFSSSDGIIKTVRERPAKLGIRYWRELD